MDIFFNPLAADFKALAGPPVIERVSRIRHSDARVNAIIAPDGKLRDDFAGFPNVAKIICDRSENSTLALTLGRNG